MDFADHYLSKQKGFLPQIAVTPAESLRFIVVIPAFCEPGIADSLESLWNCQRPAAQIEVIVVINGPENATAQVLHENQLTYSVTKEWIEKHNDPSFRFYIIDQRHMPARDAGVGLARKTGMDEAVYRYNQLNQPHGYILTFDADSRCDPDYFTAIEKAVNTGKPVSGFNVYFEHPLSGSAFPREVYQGIAGYELHLRYLNLFMHYTGFPFAQHTVGSCFGVRADAYAKQGGMNKRKAGEDFYFLHKIIPLGGFININTTRVIPSPRTSHRVPFGTGAAMTKYMQAPEQEMQTYAPQAFIDLKTFFNKVPELYGQPAESTAMLQKHLPLPLNQYLAENQFINALKEINNNSSSVTTFTKRFYRWFDAFRIIKYLNSVSRHYYPQVPVDEAACRYLALTGQNFASQCSTHELLLKFREIERGEK